MVQIVLYVKTNNLENVSYFYSTGNKGSQKMMLKTMNRINCAWKGMLLECTEGFMLMSNAAHLKMYEYRIESSLYVTTYRECI